MSREKMQGSGIFYDSADLIEFEKWLQTRMLGGATTNPVLFEKAGVLDVVGHISKMVELAADTGQNNLPISIELPDADWSVEQMVELAMEYQDRFYHNAVIKVPMKPNEPEKAFEVIYRLGQEGIRINATIGITMGQLVGAAEAGRLSRADGENYISLFWGRREEARKQILVERLKEINQEGMTVAELDQLNEQILSEIPDAAATLAMTLAYLENHSLNTRVIVGSVRNIHQIEQAFSLGADIVTITPKLLSEWMYTQRGMETVDQFNDAYRKVKDKIKLLD